MHKRNEPQKRITRYTGIVILVFLVGLVAFYLSQDQSSSESQTTVDFHLTTQPSLGDPQAPVKIIEFGDFKCPACKQFHEQVYPKLLLEYIDMNLVEFFFINFQFLGPDSITAGIAGECIYRQDEDAFWDYYDTIYRNQGPENQIWATPERILDLVQQSVRELDKVALQQCINQEKYKRDVEEDKRIGIAAGVTGTPTLFLNGQKLENWSYNALKAAIERVLLQKKS